MRRGQQGQPTATVETSPKYQRKKHRQRQAEEREWAARSGPVETTYDKGVEEVHGERAGS